MPQSQNRDLFISNELHKNLGAEACAAAEFLVLLQELDTTRGWARLGYSSLFDFCHLNLNLTRAEAYTRTRLARLASEVPQVLSLLRSGEIKLSALRILAPVLTPENSLTVFVAIRGKTTREVEDYRNTFRIHEKPAARGSVRTVYSPIEGERPCEATAERNGEPQANANNSAPHMKKIIRMALTLSEDLWEKYCRACNLSNHSSSGTDVAEMMEMLLNHYLKKHDGAAKKIQLGERHRDCASASVGSDTVTQQEELMEQKELCSVTASGVKEVRSAGASHCHSQHKLPHNVTKLSPRGEKAPSKEQASRYIPKQIRREVRERDDNRCAYVDETTGKRCDCERGQSCEPGGEQSCERPCHGREGNALGWRLAIRSPDGSQYARLAPRNALGWRLAMRLTARNLPTAALAGGAPVDVEVCERPVFYIVAARGFSENNEKVIEA